MNKINFLSLKKTLTPKEMKNVLGGSGGDYSTGCCYTCAGSNGVLNGAKAIYNASDCFDYASASCGGDESSFICYPC